MDSLPIVKIVSFSSPSKFLNVQGLLTNDDAQMFLSDSSRRIL